MNLPPEKETFAQLVAKGMSQKEAYCKAFPKTKLKNNSPNTIRTKACCLAKEVADRINELKNEYANNEIDKVKRLTEELEEIAFVKIKEIDAKDKLRAIDLLGKIYGVYEKDNQQKGEPMKDLMAAILGKTHGVANAG